MQNWCIFTDTSVVQELNCKNYEREVNWTDNGLEYDDWIVKRKLFESNKLYRNAQAVLKSCWNLWDIATQSKHQANLLKTFSTIFICCKTSDQLTSFESRAILSLTLKLHTILSSTTGEWPNRSITDGLPFSDTKQSCIIIVVNVVVVGIVGSSLSLISSTKPIVERIYED